jgi:hypothetical protein
VRLDTSICLWSVARALVAILLICGAPVICAQEAPRAEQEPPAAPVLEPVVVSAPSPAEASSELFIPGKNFELRPQGRPADILRLIPGLVIGQHMGGGKAEQYFLRGFDADHGTDVALFVDGMPVNLRSHAHGQGYADLHFLIPETLLQVDVTKGPYFVELGDFNTAGAVNFITRDFVPENIAEVAGGNWGTQRYLTLLSPTRDRLKTLFALELYGTNGPSDRPQSYQRLNAFAKARAAIGESVDATAWASYLWSSWFASGEIPERAVREGIIGRFGAIDNSQGGSTQRFNVNGELRWRPSDSDTVKVQLYGQYYQLDLFSNFTLFLNDPVNGDQIGQFDRNRIVAGFNSSYEHQATVLGLPLTTTAGFQFRLDRPRVLISNTADRQLLLTTQDVNILETSYSPFLKFEAAPFSWLRIITGARGDVFYFNVQNNLPGLLDQPNGSASKAIPSAKVNLIFGPWSQTELFANFGTGFHSNDARAVVSDPSGIALAQATAWEFGARTRLVPNVELSATYWWLNLTSELVFDGDTGTLEPSGASHRHGFELSLKAKLLAWLTFTGNFTTTAANFANGGAVPLAPRVTAFTDLTARFPWGLSASATMRYLGPRWADPDRTQTARGYTLFDLGARYRYKLGGNAFLDAFVTIENLLNVEWRETQFYFTSRLRNEPAQGVNDISYTPGNPRTVMGGLALRF